MAQKSKIEWTGSTWNPVTGCSKVSPGCKFCYVLRDWDRLAKTENSVYFNRKFTDVQYHPERLSQPVLWRKERFIFVNSMSDLFHEDLDDSIIDDVFSAMALCEALGRGHIFQVLTKRASRMHDYLNNPNTFGRIMLKMNELAHKLEPKKANLGIPVPAWPLNNVWLGVSVENQEVANERIPLLLNTPSVVRWISAEPMLDNLDLTQIRINLVCHINALSGMHYYSRCMTTINKIDWVIAGGESGPTMFNSTNKSGFVRPLEYAYVKALKDACVEYRTPFLFKQWGAYYPEKDEIGTKMIPYEKPTDDIPVLDGQNWIAYPRGR